MKKEELHLIFATHNQHKADEIQNLLPDFVKVSTLSEINCFEDIPEEQDTLEGNALQKARYVFEKYGVNCFADDTGLEVLSLNGEPGVYSARYSGPEKDSDKNMDLVLNKLDPYNDRTAQFRTVIALVLNGEEFLFEGIIKGEISKDKKGDKGFGYDPIFIPVSSEKTFAEMNLEEKNKLSHRSKAIQKMNVFLNQKK